MDGKQGKRNLKKKNTSIEPPEMPHPSSRHTLRQDHEFPEATERWGWKFHHLGIPTRQIRMDERYIAQFKFYVAGFPTSPFGIEWMRFDEDSPIDPLIQSVPHLAFVVPDLDHELRNRGFRVIVPPNPPSEGVRVAMIEHNGAPVELMEFEPRQR